MATHTKQLVDVETGLIDRNIYFDDEIYRQELENVFARSWLLVGHESQIPNTGDYITNTMGEDPVIMVRDRSDNINVLLNTCRHRGNALTRADVGNAHNFLCTYHGWTYSTDGRLISVPGYQELYHEDLDMEQWGLIKCPQVESFHGLVFACWDPDAPPLLEYMGEYAWFLETRVNPTGQGSEFNGGIFKWVMDHNWKFAADNFVGDGYHGGISHKSATLAGHRVLNSRVQGQGGGQQGPNIPDRDRFRGQTNPLSFRMATKYGHGAGLSMKAPDAPVVPPDMPEPAASYFRERHRLMEQRLGSNRARLSGFNAMFPNFSINSSADQIHLWHPRGPLATESWVYILVDKGAPAEVKDALALSGSRHFGPTGMFEQDDSDNWRLSTTGAKSVIGRRYPLHYAMGLRHDDWAAPEGDLPKRRIGSLGDTNQLNFYRHWQELYSGKSWKEIRAAAQTYV